MAFKTFSALDVLTAADVNTYLMKQAVIVCTSGTRPAAPVEGMTIYETDTGCMRVHSGSAWRRFAIDVETHAPATDSDSTTISGITSTSWAAGTPVVSVVFTAPPSGRAFVTVSGTLVQSSNGHETRLSYEVRQGSTVGIGTVALASSSVRAVVCGRAVNTGGPSMVSASYRRLMTGMSAGTAYHVRAMYSVSGGTGAVESREVTVEPVS